MPHGLLESFHPWRSGRPTNNTKLIHREASHFITTAIAIEEEEKGPEEGIEDATSPGGLPFVTELSQLWEHKYKNNHRSDQIPVLEPI
jgi:hypothetical protein